MRSFFASLGASPPKEERGVADFDERLRLIALLFYAVGILVVVMVTDSSLYQDGDFAGANRAGLNAVAATAAVFALASLAVSWERFGRNAYAVMPSAGTVLIAFCVYFSGGWDSFAYLLFVLPSVFYGLYFSTRVVALGMVGIILAGASPVLYEPNIHKLAEFLAVPVPLYLVVAFVSNYIVRQTTLREQEKERLRQQAEVDGLTGISNRRHLDARLDEELERARRFGEGFALLFMDVDDFKKVNDEHGHALGDEVLKLVARTLRSGIRQVDTVARFGGEEFVALLPGTPVPGARSFFERVQGEIARRSEEEWGFEIRMSAGVVAWEDGSDATTLLKSADAAMYEAKRRGKNRLFVA